MNNIHVSALHTRSWSRKNLELNWTSFANIDPEPASRILFSSFISLDLSPFPNFKGFNLPGENIFSLHKLEKKREDASRLEDALNFLQPLEISEWSGTFFSPVV